MNNLITGDIWRKKMRRPNFWEAEIFAYFLEFHLTAITATLNASNFWRLHLRMPNNDRF